MYQYKAKIINVVDGDTVDADIKLGFGICVRLRLRVLDYDAPETYRPSCQKEKEHGETAKEKAEGLLLGQEVLIETKKKGKYGRYLATIIMPDYRDFAVVMKESGMQKRECYEL